MTDPVVFEGWISERCEEGSLADTGVVRLEVHLLCRINKADVLLRCVLYALL